MDGTRVTERPNDGSTSLNHRGPLNFFCGITPGVRIDLIQRLLEVGRGPNTPSLRHGHSVSGGNS